MFRMKGLDCARRGDTSRVFFLRSLSCARAGARLEWDSVPLQSPHRVLTMALHTHQTTALNSRLLPVRCAGASTKGHCKLTGDPNAAIWTPQ